MAALATHGQTHGFATQIRINSDSEKSHTASWPALRSRVGLCIVSAQTIWMKSQCCLLRTVGSHPRSGLLSRPAQKASLDLAPQGVFKASPISLFESQVVRKSQIIRGSDPQPAAMRRYSSPRLLQVPRAAKLEWAAFYLLPLTHRLWGLPDKLKVIHKDVQGITDKES